MERKRFISRITLILALAVLAVGTGVWLANRGLREPVFEGKKLSWWLTDEVSLNERGRLTDEEIRSLGPEGARWLGYTATRTSIWDFEEPQGPASQFAEFKWWVRGRWMNYSGRRFETLRQQAAYTLNGLGPDAAPAIPYLVKGVRSDGGYALNSAETLVCTGAAGWPEVANLIQHGDSRTRVVMVANLHFRWQSAAPFDWQDFVQAIELLTPLTLDTNPTVADYSGQQLTSCFISWAQGANGDDQLCQMFDRFDTFSPAARRQLLDRLAGESLPQRTGASVPRLVLIAAAADPYTRLGILSKVGRLRWSAVADAIRRGDARTRRRLAVLFVFDEALIEMPSDLRAEAFAEVIEFFVESKADRDEGESIPSWQEIEDGFDWGWEHTPEGVRLALENLTRRGTQEPDELLRVQLLGALAIADPEDPRWVAKLYEFTNSPNSEIMEAAERALIRVLK